MPKGRHGKGGRGKDTAGKKKEKRERKARRREEYIRRGDPEFRSFSEQLAQQGLRLQDVPGDGNCLFRALAAQLRGGDHTHQSIRRDVVDYMRQNRQEFEQFVAEEEEDYDGYCDQLEQDGEYAGNDVIVAFSRVFSANVIIHQLNYPRWEVLAPAKTTPTKEPVESLHVAYLNGEHYCSVFPLASDAVLPGPLKADTTPRPPAKSRSLETCGEVPLRGGSVGVKKRVVSTAGGGGRGGEIENKEELEEVEEVETIISATGCKDQDLAKQVLLETGYNVDLAIVELLQIMQFETDKTEKPVSEGKRKGSVVKSPSGAPESKGHLSNRERKAKAKAERKERRREEREGRKDTAATGKTSPVASVFI